MGEAGTMKSSSRSRLPGRAGLALPPRPRVRGWILAMQLALLCVLLAGWELLPRIPGITSTSHLLDPFFISSPSRILTRLVDLATGRDESVVVWGYVWPTLQASLLGAFLGMVLGAVMGMLLSSSRSASAVLHPFIVAANAVPRIALIPIVVILVGPGLVAVLLVSTMVVFFVTFYNAYEGGRQVAPEVLDNARLLGATELELLQQIRLPYVLAWTLAVLPLAVTFAVLTVVTTEILTGIRGMGQLLVTANAQADSSLTFSVVIVLSLMGVSVVVAAEGLKRRILHWWGR